MTLGILPICILLAVIRLTSGISLTPCTGGVTEVRENQISPVTCSGLDSNHSVSWEAQNPSLSYQLGTCYADSSPGQPSTCVGFGLPGIYSVTMTTPTTSVITIDPASNVMAADVIVNHTLVCAQDTDSDMCTMNLIYPSEGVSCSVHFLTPTSSAWSVSGQCNISKAYSSLGTYTCQWYQTLQSSSTERVGQLVTMTTMPTVEHYQSGECYLSASFPTDGGQYSYNAVVNPGSRTHAAAFIGFNEIRSPNASHDCPQYVSPGQTVTCTCGGDLGSPRGLAQWQRLNSDQLTVTSDLAGQQQTCHVIYNNTTVSPRHYTVQLASPPSPPTISSTDYPLIASVSRGVTFTCVSDTPGQPPAIYTWPLTQGGQSGTDGLGRGTLTFDTLSREHDGKVVSCRASNLYTDNRQTVEDGSLTLDVFYHPEISITLVGEETSSHCSSLTPDTVQCEVTEGQRAHFNCSAVSNPAPRNISWHTATDNGFDIVIDSVNRSQHSDVFNCSVVTGIGGYSNDSRLPLRSWKTLTILVKSTDSSITDEFPVAVVAGGVVAALVVIAVIAVGLFLFRRRKTNRAKEQRIIDVPAAERTEQPALQRRNNYPQQRSSYEDVDMDEATPVIVPRQQAEAPTDGATDADRLYARVVKQKDRAPQPATEQSSAPDAAVYAQVIKPKKMQAGPASAEAEASAGGAAEAAVGSASEDQDISRLKPTPAKKLKSGKQKEKRNRLEPVHGNAEPLNPAAHENPAYEGDTNSGTPAEEDDSLTMNEDGLVYSKVDFNDDQRRRAEQIPPARENTDYAAIDFNASMKKQ